MKVLYALMEIKNLLSRQPDRHGVEFDMHQITTMEEFDEMERSLLDQSRYSSLI